VSIFELWHFLIERSGITPKAFAVCVAIFAYVLTGSLFAVGVQITGVRPLRAWSILSSIFLIASSVGLYLFPNYPVQVIVTVIFPGAVYVYACHLQSRIDRP